MMIVKIGDIEIGPGKPCYIIAEAGVNHNNDLNNAYELIRKAASSGADAIKFQTYEAEKLVTRTAPRFWTWDGEVKKIGTQFDSYSLLDKLPLDAYEKMVSECEENNIEFLSTPFDFESATFLNELGMKAFKIASCDITYHQFLQHIAEFNKPIILSTGASTIGEIQDAISIIKKTGNNRIVILHCILTYPAPYSDMNLNMMRGLKTIFKEHPIGLSDHSLGLSIPYAAVALGADVIEKHYTFDKTLGLSADHWLSIDANELKMMVAEIRNIESAFGSWEKQCIASEKNAKHNARRSIVLTNNLIRGTTLTKSDITYKRPGHGIEPKFADLIIGRKINKDLNEDTTIMWEDIC